MPKRLSQLFKLIFLPLVENVSKKCSFIMPASENQVTQSMLRIMRILLIQSKFYEKAHEPTIKQDEVMQRFDMIFQYAAMWSIGAIVDDASQRKFF